MGGAWDIHVLTTIQTILSHRIHRWMKEVTLQPNPNNLQL